MVVKSKRIYAEDGLKDGFLVIKEGKIEGVEERWDGDFVDYSDMRLIPGIFDTHNHGTFGYSLINKDEDDSPEKAEKTLRGYLSCCAAQGVTSIMPTVTGGMIKQVADAAPKLAGCGADIIGIHSEGPWLNRTGEKGIWEPWPEVSLEKAKQMVEDGRGKLKLVGLAPEIEGIGPIADYFLSQGIVLAFAHSNNNYEEAMEAYDKKGLSVATHTGNVMTGMHHRDIGGLGASLLHENVYCEIICDGMHISLEMLKVFFRIKDCSKFMMISDLTALSGAQVGKYPNLFPGFNINVMPNGFVLSDEGRLLGSSQPVLFGIYNLVEKLKMPMETVLQMASLNPSKKYGVADRKGSIKVGKDADFVAITDDYNATATYVSGKKVFDRKDGAVQFNPEFMKPL